MFFIPAKFVLLNEIAGALDVPVDAVNLNCSFQENGGTSISLVRLLHAFKTHKVRLKYDVIFSICSIGEILHQAVQQATISTTGGFCGIKRDLSSLIPSYHKGIKREDYPGSLETARTGRIVGSVFCRMTDMQSEFLQSSLSKHGKNVIHYRETHDPSNIMMLKRAWKNLTKLEPILRSTYEIHDSGTYLVEQPPSTFDWEETVVSDEANFELLANQTHPEKNFFGSSFRVVTLLPDGGPGIEKSCVIWRVHHSLIDGYSHFLLQSKVSQYLSSNRIDAGTPFSEYVMGLSDMEEEQGSAATAFWAAKLEQHPGSVSTLPLPLPPATRAKEIAPTGVIEVEMVNNSLAPTCKTMGVTVSAFYYAAWALTLRSYTGSDEVCFGVVLDGRTFPIPGIKSVVGPTINTLPLYITIENTMSVSRFLQTVFREALDLTTYQWSSPKHGYRREFDTALSVATQDVHPRRGQSEMLEPSVAIVSSDIPLQIEIVQDGRIRMTYDCARYSQQQVQRLAEAYRAAISLPLYSASTVEQCLSSNLDTSQRRTLGALGNWDLPTTRIGSVRDDLVSLFAQAVKENPNHVAVQRGNETLSYKELYIRSKIVSRRISSMLPRGSVVCVHADRTVEWIIAIYAVLQAGAVYCPLDPHLPEALRNQNFVDSTAKLFLVGSNADRARRPQSNELCLSVEDILNKNTIGSWDDGKDTRKTQPGDPAYLCFTSGSTGRPKGVICQHQGLVAFQQDFTVRLCARPGWKIAQVMSPSFDGSIHEIFSALSYGSTLVLQETSRPIDHLKRADAAILTPSAARALDIGDFPHLKMVYLVGEAVSQDTCDIWASTKLVYNMYGPTEATCGATIKQLLPCQPVTLGKPNPSTRIYILDASQNLVPCGMEGEICLAGVQVGRGYIRQSHQTRRRFLPDSVNPQFQENMYRTGDRGYWDESGELMSLGRFDRQCKLRGFRIDLDALEAQIIRASSQPVRVAVAICHQDLVAQIQPREIDMERLRAELRLRIPVYALPRHITAVDSFPKTAVGKLDYRVVAETMETREECFHRRTGNLEAIVDSALRNVLGIVSDAWIAANVSFLDLGANSLHLLSLARQLSKSLGKKVTVELLLRYPTRSELCHILANVHCSNEEEEGPLLGEAGVSPIEQYWLKRYQANSDTSSFNINFVCEIDRNVDREKLSKSWNAVLARHRILHCKYVLPGKGEYRKVYDEQCHAVQEVPHIDIDVEIHAPFDPSLGNLIRVKVSPYHMTVVVSHIICDLASLNILLGEVAEVYRGRPLAPVSKAYAGTKWLGNTAEGLSFWNEYLKGIGSKKATHINEGQQRKTWEGSSEMFTIPHTTLELIEQYKNDNHVTFHQLAIAAVVLALQDEPGACDMILGAPYLNRQSEEDQTVVGLFLEPLPMRMQYCPTKDEQENAYIRAVQHCSRSALAHPVSFQLLLGELCTEVAFPEHPLFDIMVSVHDIDQRLNLPISGIKPMSLWTRGAKFKLMTEFTVEATDRLTLRLEYSTECFDRKSIVFIGFRIERALWALSVGKRFTEIQTLLHQEFALEGCPF